MAHAIRAQRRGSSTKKLSASSCAREQQKNWARIADLTFQQTQVGTGSPTNPIRQPLRDTANATGCLHCPMAECACEAFADCHFQVTHAVALKRVTEVSGNNALCAKSLNPCFVSRLAHLLDVKPTDTFYDLGCGNGSILFQMALITGARCVGIEISAHNAEVARQTWAMLKPILEERTGKQMPPVEIITGDLTQLIRQPSFNAPTSKILTSNLLMPRALTHFMSEVFRGLPVGARVACFDDLYPHARACSRSRDPKVFELFDMKDYVWPPLAVEWCSVEGTFFVHTRV